MSTPTSENRVITVLGCTASGKSNLGRRLAQALNGEIVSIDSMKVYRGMDIGTAKPSAEERAAIPHHLIDVVEPWESFSVARFVELADAAIADVHARGKPAIAVGGTMLYFKAFYEGLFEAPSADEDFRRRLRARAEQEGLDVLHAELAAVDPAAAERIHRNDLKRIERALEVYTLTGRPISALQREWAEPRQRRPDWHWILLGLRREKTRASKRINDRVRRMVQSGLVEEARRLWEDSRGISEPARQAVGYQELFEHFAGNCPLDYAIEQVKIHSRHLAKHQRTWIRKRTDVHWIEVEKGENNYSVCKRALHLLAEQGMLHADERPILDAMQ